MRHRYGQVDPTYQHQLASASDNQDGPLWMVNLMSYRDVADYEDQRLPQITGRQADALYTPLGPLEAVGAEIVFVADVQDQFLADSPRWDRVAVVKYPTRKSFVDMQKLPEFQELHVHKDAGMEHTIIMGTQPMVAPVIESTELRDWNEVPHPPTEEDGDVMVIHVLRFHDEVGAASPEDMETYTSRAALAAIPHGVRIAGWFEVEGTIVGDGRRWDQVRFNAFPSRRAFMAMALDPDRLAAQRNHREVAIADTYTLLTRPTLNRLG